MPKKPRTPKQLANDERLRNLAVARKQAKEIVESPEEVKVDKPDTDLASLQRQVDEVMETNALLKALLLRGNDNQPGHSVNVGRGNQLIGEVDKYLVDPENYPDPTKRLSQENRLQSIAFNHNYELEYDFKIRSYETKTGVNMREPEFLVTLLRVVLDDQGERVQIVGKDGISRDKFFIARRMMFHEDPQAALVIARENNIAIDSDNEKTFLDEMRYLRVRDWLFDFFWPRGSESKEGIREEAVGGTIVQVYTKSSVEPSSVDFDKIQTKV
jgi:hypothetical protein